MTAVLNTTKLLEIFIACDDFVKKLSRYQLESNYQTDKIAFKGQRVLTR
jgi:hypothetical protein